MLPTVYGPWFQAECRTSLGAELLPSDGPSVRRIVDAFHAEGVGCGGWAVPRYLKEAEGQAQGWAAANCDWFCLDCEPYAGFLADSSASPAGYIRGFLSACQAAPWISLVPAPSGIDAIGHVTDWLKWARGIRPQCYWTDYESLRWPEPAGSYLQTVQRNAGTSLPIVPIIPHRALDPVGVDAVIGAAAGDVDIWVLG